MIGLALYVLCWGRLRFWIAAAAERNPLLMVEVEHKGNTKQLFVLPAPTAAPQHMHLGVCRTLSTVT
eukprot:CAMPEP_0172755394 /NCGR_PEP_ID=MMETSP1074-20121228/159775_1 /TAXON_ID=2916 /ORGANISM="Ceratium fusus, Strain PA161109" /LENGTH=66 /DNA_ID=CAMNT_0013588473 /DNA_START=67 /DNA_END=264 /DNA_ORIENTATION=+